MKITKVIVEKLFGLYDYELNFFTEEYITILHGPNGVGKTTILKLIKSIIEGDVLVLDTTPFVNTILYLDNGDTIKVSKAADYESICEQNAFSSYLMHLGGRPRDLVFPITYTIYNGDKVKSKLKQIRLRDDLSERSLSAIAIARRNAYRHRNEDGTDRDVTVAQFLGFDENNPICVSDELNNLLEEYSSLLNVKIIQANRIYKFTQQESRSSREDRMVTLETVNDIAEDLKRKIESARKEKEKVSDNLDRTFPKRVINQYAAGIKEYDSKIILKKLMNLEIKRDRLIELGIIDKENIEKEPINLIQDALPIIDLYVKDSEAKYAVFDKLIDKLELYKKIFTDTMPFQSKQIEIDAINGIAFKSDTGKNIPLNKLSSGEKNALVLFYDLIFSCSDGTLLLVDEPEISLHISWQVEYINTLLEVCKMRDIQAIVATHSPNIVDDHYDLLEDMIKED